MTTPNKAAKQPTTADAVVGSLAIVIILAAIVAAIAVHWQWGLIIGIVGLAAVGLVKFGWDAATAVEKKARE